MGTNIFEWMPEQASSWAVQVDWINSFITIVSAVCTFGITGVMLYFAWKYRRRGPNDQTAYITHNATIETVWTVVPTIICVFVFIVGFKVYKEMRTPPADALEISVTARKWTWSYKYPNGKTADRDLVVPVGRAVKLITRSVDVNHSFFVPAMRVKEDVIASEYHYLWFTPTKIGNYRIYCAEYCGTDHSAMGGTLKVVSEAEYQDFVSNRVVEQLTPAQLGKKLFDLRCSSCHTLDGSKKIGPSFKGLFGRQETLTDGSTVTADENYIRESIHEPLKKVVKDYAPAMPPGLANDDEIEAIIAFIKEQK